MKQTQLSMFKNKTKKRATPNRLLNVCKLINSGISPTDAAKQLQFSQHYITLMRKCGIIQKEIDGKFIALNKIHQKRYNDFIKIRNEYNENKIRYIKPKENKNKNKIILQYDKPKRNFFQKFIAKLFNL
jgi:hypothetical protein